jgi:four helix bundle protein
MTLYFDHEKLDVYQHSLQFVVWATALLETITTKAAVRDQLDRASTSVPLNIAEGNGKFSMKDRCRFLGIAYGSALECAAALDVMAAKKLATAQAVEEGKAKLKNVVSMLVGLINSLMSRVCEEAEEYVALGETLEK